MNVGAISADRFRWNFRAELRRFQPPLGMGFVLLLLLALPVQAQWLTQSFSLGNTWNAIYTHVDASHATLDELIAGDASNPIQEVWMWTPASDVQFISSPAAPVAGGSQWLVWKRTDGPNSTFNKLLPNAAYLVKVDYRDSKGMPVKQNGPSYFWHVKGRPVPPRNSWTVTGLNFTGFPVNPSQYPYLADFLAHGPAAVQDAEIHYYYREASATSRLVSEQQKSSLKMERGHGVWIRSGDAFNSYFGPFQLILQELTGMDFGDSRTFYRIRLRNLTAGELTVTATLLPSEAAPAGQPAVAGTPPLVLRGELNITNLTHAFTRFADGPQSASLRPKDTAGSEMEWVLGIDRSQMPDAAAALFAGILRFTDSLNLTAVDVPVSAISANTVGLWVGSAAVTQVRAAVTNYLRDDQGNLKRDGDGHAVVDPNGTFSGFGGVPRPYPLRLILHHDGAKAALLQRVFFGLQAGKPVVATSEKVLDADKLAAARRISAIHLPFHVPTGAWPNVSGSLARGGSLAFTVSLPYDDHASNPFLHTYHPDHDNLDFDLKTTLAQGKESYGLRRDITLHFNRSGGDFASITSLHQSLSGDYEEILTLAGRGAATRGFAVRGLFTLNRISDISVLTTP